MSAAVSRLLSLLHGGPQVIRNGLGFLLTVIAKKTVFGHILLSFFGFYGSPCHHCTASTVEAALIALEAGLSSALPPRTRVEKAPAAGP